MHRRNYKGRKFGREAAQRRALFRGLATSLVLHEKIKTTKEKAKEVRPIVEKLITLAKRGDLHAMRQAHSYLLDEKAVIKLKQELAPLYKERNGGYTRILNLGFRKGDGANEAIIELLDTEKLIDKAKAQKEGKNAKKEEKGKIKEQK